MIINKSQGHFIKYVSLEIWTPVLSHGQLYVALSRTTSIYSLKIFLPKQNLPKKWTLYWNINSNFQTLFTMLFYLTYFIHAKAWFLQSNGFFIEIYCPHFGYIAITQTSICVVFQILVLFKKILRVLRLLYVVSLLWLK